MGNADEDYGHLSADWRHRDQLTWQLHSLLVALSGALIAAVVGLTNKTGALPELQHVRDFLLYGGLFFAALITMSLGQNLYLQTVAEDLMDEIKKGTSVKVSSIPKRRADGPKFIILLGRTILKTGSTGLFLLSSCLTGFLAFLLSDLKYESEAKFAWGIFTAITVAVLTILLNLVVYWRAKQP